MKLRPGEIRFWQEAYLAEIGRGEFASSAARRADDAVQYLRKRLADPGSRPDEGRL